MATYTKDEVTCQHMWPPMWLPGLAKLAPLCDYSNIYVDFYAATFGAILYPLSYNNITLFTAVLDLLTAFRVPTRIVPWRTIRRKSCGIISMIAHSFPPRNVITKIEKEIDIFVHFEGDGVAKKKRHQIKAGVNNFDVAITEGSKLESGPNLSP